jgi:hypothetical protein
MISFHLISTENGFSKEPLLGSSSSPNLIINLNSGIDVQEGTKEIKKRKAEPENSISISHSVITFHHEYDINDITLLPLFRKQVICFLHFHFISTFMYI